MPEKSIGVPTARTMGSAFGDYAYGAAGGFIQSLVQNFLGSGFLGTLAGPIIASAFIKGTRGQTISTVAGYIGGMNLLASIGSLGGILGGSGESSRGSI